MQMSSVFSPIHLVANIMVSCSVSLVRSGQKRLFFDLSDQLTKHFSGEKFCYILWNMCMLCIYISRVIALPSVKYSG